MFPVGWVAQFIKGSQMLFYSGWGTFLQGTGEPLQATQELQVMQGISPRRRKAVFIFMQTTCLVPALLSQQVYSSLVFCQHHPSLLLRFTSSTVQKSSLIYSKFCHHGVQSHYFWIVQWHLCSSHDPNVHHLNTSIFHSFCISCVLYFLGIPLLSSNLDNKHGYMRRDIRAALLDS